MKIGTYKTPNKSKDPLTIIVDDFSEMMWSDYDSLDDFESETLNDFESKNLPFSEDSKTESDINFLKKFSGVSDKMDYKNKHLKLDKNILKQDDWVVLEVDDDVISNDFDFDDLFGKEQPREEIYIELEDS